MAANNRLDRVGAVRRAQRIRDGVSSVSDVLDTLVEVQERRDWTTLGYKDFDEYCAVEFGPDQLKLTAERRGQVVGILIAGGMSKRGAAKALGVSEGTVRNDVKRQKSIPVAQNYAPDDVTAALTQAITETAAHTSGAVPPASTDSASPVVGEPGDSEQAAESSGTQTAADGPHPPTADAVEVPGDRAEEAVAPDGGLVLPSGVTPEERIEVMSADEFEAAVNRQLDALHLTREQLAAMAAVDDWVSLAAKKLWLAIKDSPAADPLAPPSPQQPGQYSPTGLEAAQPREGRSETDHQQDAGVSSPAGEAPEVASTDPVEPVELEGGGTAQDPPSSSDPDALMTAFAALVHYLSQLDADALGPLLHEDDMPTLFDHIETFEVFVRRLGKARFTEMVRTP